MVLRVRVRSAKLFVDLNSFSRMSSYVSVIGGGNRFKTVTDKNGGKQPVWEDTLSFQNNPPNIKIETWVEHPDGDILAGEILIDLCNFYQREPYRIQPKTIGLVSQGKTTGQIKLQMDFDYDGMNKERLNRLKQEGIKPQTAQGGKHNKIADLQIGTVIAQGKKKAQQKQRQQQQQINHYNEKPYQKPPTGNNNNHNNNHNHNHNHKPPTGKKQQAYDYNNPWEGEYNNRKQQEKRGNNKGYNLLQLFGNLNKQKTNNNGWDL